jgi:hypothetical protein
VKAGRIPQSALYIVHSTLPAHAISTKNKHLLVIYSIPARGFTAAVSVFRGTPPPKPLKCKSVSNHLGARLRWPWVEPTGEEFVLLCAIFSLAVADIIETSLGYCSQTVRLSLPLFTISCRKKKPCLHEVSRVQKSLFDSLPAHLRIIQACFGTLPTMRPGVPKAQRTAGVQPTMPCRLRDRHCRPNRGCVVHAGSHRTCKTSNTRMRLQSTYTLRG